MPANTTPAPVAPADDADAAREGQRLALIERLEAEGRDDLAAQLAKCNQPLNLVCICCGTRREVRTRCKRKWCPICARIIAARRTHRVRAAVEAMQWPLFVTLTMQNVEDMSDGAIRHLRRAFGKLRRMKSWSKTVTGGVAAIEVTNIGNGWHPHVHAVVDCKWLAWKTPEPNWRRDTQLQKDRLCQAAHNEIVSRWAKALGHETAGVFVKRASALSITTEVLKYSVKGSDLLAAPGEIGPAIDALSLTRLVTTFGTLYRLPKPPDDYPKALCPRGNADWMPWEVAMKLPIASWL